MDYQALKARAEAVLLHQEAYAAANDIPLGDSVLVQNARQIIAFCEKKLLDAKKKNQ